jgi:hypothetical protein
MPCFAVLQRADHFINVELTGCDTGGVTMEDWPPENMVPEVAEV